MKEKNLCEASKMWKSRFYYTLYIGRAGNRQTNFQIEIKNQPCLALQILFYNTRTRVGRIFQQHRNLNSFLRFLSYPTFLNVIKFMNRMTGFSICNKNPACYLKLKNSTHPTLTYLKICHIFRPNRHIVLGARAQNVLFCLFLF